MSGLNETITLRPFREDDLDAVLGLLRSSLGETSLLQRTPELFAWKHLDNPFGRSIILVADAEGTIAGLRAFMRWELTTPQGETLRCVRAVDTATHPDFQRRGIFSTLTEAAVEAAREDGVHLIFNTPNEKSGAGYLKMGWQQVGPIGVMMRPGIGLLRKGTGDGIPQTGDLVPGSEPLMDFPPVTARLPRGLRTARTPDYLRWRFTAHPTARYAAVEAADGIAVVRPNLRSGRRELVLSELIGPGSAAAARETARRSRADYMVGWFSKGSPERSAAVSAGLIPLPKVTALTLVARPLRDLPVDVTSPASWDLAMGDLELL